MTMWRWEERERESEESLAMLPPVGGSDASEKRGNDGVVARELAQLQELQRSYNCEIEGCERWQRRNTETNAACALLELLRWRDESICSQLQKR